MARIRVGNLKEGMTVARDVTNIDGMLLVATETSLTARQIGILQAWGVSEVEVANAEAAEGNNDPLARLSSEELAAMQTELKARFWQAEQFTEVEAEIFQLMLHRHASRPAAA